MKKIYRVLKNDLYEFAHIRDPVYCCEKDSVVTTDEGNQKKKQNKTKKLKRMKLIRKFHFFYPTYKGA